MSVVILSNGKKRCANIKSRVIINLYVWTVFIDMPVDIRDKYQYFTEANMQKLQLADYTDKFHTLEEGIDVYVRKYLVKGEIY